MASRQRGWWRRGCMQKAQLAQSALEVCAHLLSRDCVRHEHQAHALCAAQSLLQRITLGLRLELSASRVHWIGVLTVLNALKFASELERFAPGVKLQAPIRGRIAQKRWTSLWTRNAEKSFERAAHQILPRVRVCIHQRSRSRTKRPIHLVIRVHAHRSHSFHLPAAVV